MSSYYDHWGRKIYEAKTLDEQEKLVAIVVKRVRAYYTYVHEHCLKADKERVAIIQQKVEKAVIAFNGRPYSLVEYLHDIGHDFGTLGVRLRGGRGTVDNPYYPGNYTMGDE